MPLPMRRVDAMPVQRKLLAEDATALRGHVSNNFFLAKALALAYDSDTLMGPLWAHIEIFNSGQADAQPVNAVVQDS